MIVTSFYPVFYTDDIEGEIKKFTEDLGFQLKHRPPIEFLDYAVLENANGNKLDLVCSRFPADNFQNGFLGMRANVNDFDEGVSYFESQGYSLFGESHETSSSITALLTKDSKEYIILFHHKNIEEV